VLAAIALARGELSRADELISRARKAAESNGWTMLYAWTRALAGRLRIHRYLATRDGLELSRAKTDLLAAIDLFEEHSTGWTEEVDPGEVFALLAAVLRLAGNRDAALPILERGLKLVPAQNLVSHRALDASWSMVEGIEMDPALEWFEQRGYQRFSRLWRQLAG
jgi:tetratricopeptide (TPR) repeat protein